MNRPTILLREQRPGRDRCAARSVRTRRLGALEHTFSRERHDGFGGCALIPCPVRLPQTHTGNYVRESTS